jgi:plasmid stabilization system protein ParE
MAYRVDLSRNAAADLDALYIFLADRAPSQGIAWFNGLERAILALRQMPRRYRIAAERLDPEQPCESFIMVGSPHVYRVFFTIERRAKVVTVLHIRHGARQRPTPSDLRDD